MSYCFNPDCQKPQNIADAENCSSCGSKLLLSPSISLREIKSEAALKELEIPLAFRYRAIKPIGQGGFGRTFLAVDENKSFSYSHCVIKQFFPHNSSPEKAAELFHQEAMQLETLGKHPQIPELLAHFEQDGQQYLVQEFIAGKNLAEELAQKGAFNEILIRQLLQDLLPVLHFVHKSKVIHRDIKPENIIRRTHPYQGGITGFIPILPTDLGTSQPSVLPGFARDNQLVLVDFGAAKKVTGNGLPQTGTIIGSAAYTAPEQLMGKAVFASDIYSLGVTCIHLLTEVPPFDLFDSREGAWAWRDYLKVPVSDNLGDILDKMLQGATNRRYHAAGAIIRHLNPKPVYLETLAGTPESAMPAAG
ncbi:MAG TPA: serine/threonine-protein kinase, partial [Kamptonema sp.]|nr:serine/threonine-protein kinase [Kamptonema sp.]